MTEPDHVPLKCKQLAPVVKAACTGAGAVTTHSSEPDHCNQQIPIHFKNSRIRPYTTEHRKMSAVTH